MPAFLLKTLNDTLPQCAISAPESSKKRQQKLVWATAQTEFGCNGQLLPWNVDMVMKWQGMDLCYGNITPENREDVQYKLYEMNWRFKLLVLDLHITGKDNKAIDFAIKRREIVSRVWSKTGSDGVIVFPNDENNFFNIMLISFSTLPQTRKALTNFYTVMMQWPGFQSKFQDRLIPTMNAVQLHVIAKELFMFYCQTFYSHYYRLPILLRFHKF